MVYALVFRFYFKRSKRAYIIPNTVYSYRFVEKRFSAKVIVVLLENSSRDVFEFNFIVRKTPLFEYLNLYVPVCTAKKVCCIYRVQAACSRSMYTRRNYKLLV